MSKKILFVIAGPRLKGASAFAARTAAEGAGQAGADVEIVELPDHPWFVGCQFHPEFKSRPMRAHPLFHDFIAAAVKQSRKR